MFFGGLAAIYTAIVVSVRGRERREIAETLAVEEYVSDVLPDSALLSTLSDEQRRKIMDSISEAGRRQVRVVMRSARDRSRIAALGAVLAALSVAASITPLTSFVSDWFASVIVMNP